MIPLKTRFFKIITIFFSIWFVGYADVLGQTADSGKKGDFINMGYVSVSREYVLAENLTSITFKVKNNTTRSIHNIFAWVYEYKESKGGGSPSDFRLVNNPNKGGTLVSGDAHRPGTVVEWRFPLIASGVVNDSAQKFVLRVSPSAIFFANFETKEKPRK